MQQTLRLQVAYLGRIGPPATASGLKLYLDAERGIYQDSAGTTVASADTDPVGRWEDQSGNGNHFTQATAGSRPILKLNQSPTGRPGIQFDGVNDFMSCVNNFISGWTSGHILTRLKGAADPPGGGSSIGAIYRFADSVTETDYPFTDSLIYGGFLSASAWNSVNPSPALTDYHTFEEFKDGTFLTTMLDGSIIVGATARANGTNATPQLGTKNGTTLFGAFTLTRLLVYDGQLAVDDRTNVENWMNV